MAGQSKMEKLQQADLIGEDVDDDLLAEVENSLSDDDVDHLVRIRKKIKHPGVKKGGRFKIF